MSGIVIMHYEMENHRSVHKNNCNFLLLILELHFCHIELLGLINPIFWLTEKPRNAATFVHDPY
jgi:hypothetical protein